MRLISDRSCSQTALRLTLDRHRRGETGRRVAGSFHGGAILYMKNISLAEAIIGR